MPRAARAPRKPGTAIGNGSSDEQVGKRASFKFNIRAFHDAVLELGSVPLPVVTARVDRFITEHGKGPYPDME